MSDEAIQVVVRCRPMNRKEKEESRSNIITVDVPLYQVHIRNPDEPTEDPKSFTFNRSYDDNTQQRLFYEDCCFNLVESVLQGFNGTIFAYGQTGCGKSFTMQGPNNTIELRGVIPNSFNHIFEAIKGSSDVQYLIRCSYLEIYNEEVRDLLVTDQKNAPKCEIKEDPAKGIYVKGLSSVPVDTEEAMARVLDSGMDNRHVASTLMNSESSRSHSIFTIIIEMSSVDADSGKEMLKAGKLNLVDLAGSERQKKTGATGKAALEGTKINLSLSSLGNVISALADGKSKHIPYRDSKLTRLLQDSLGGNTKTLMIAAISPADYNYDETMSTLRYANRAKNIKNKPKINEDPKDTMLREYKEEIEKLRQLLAQSGLSLPLPTGMAGATSLSVVHESDGPSTHMSDVAVRERDVAVEALKQKEEEVARERAQREELSSRLVQLQSKLMGQNGDESVGESSEQAEAKVLRKKRLVKQESKLMEQVESNKVVENAMKARLANESVESELDELRQALMQTQDMASQGSKSLGDVQRNTEKIISKIKTKYEKKLAAAKKETEDAREEFFSEQQLLLESLMEQRRDTLLLERICDLMLPQTMYRNILEYSKWDEDGQDWLMPSPRTIRGLAEESPSTNSSNNSITAARLPSISNSKALADELLSMDGRLTELKIPLSGYTTVALPSVGSSTAGSPKEGQSHTDMHSQSLPSLNGKSRPPSNYVNTASATSTSKGSLPSMPQLGKVAPNAQENSPGTSSSKEDRAKSRKKEKRAMATPIDTPAQTEETSVEGIVGPISDWGFSKDAGDECYSPKGDKSEGDYELQGDDVTAQSKDKMKKRKKKQRASEDVDEDYVSSTRLTQNAGFLPKLC